MRDRLLVRLFLWRFLEHDLVSPNTDRRDVLSAAGGALVAFTLFVSVLIAWGYQLNIDLPPGMTSLSFVDDRFLFVSSSMLVMALAAVTQWDALVLDARDTAVLGTLPLPRAVIVRAKFAATALFALGVLAVWNACPTLLRLGAIPIGLPIGFPGAFRLTLAHAVATGAAGAFGFIAVLGLRETMFAVLGADRFRRVSALLQALLLVGGITGLILLPGQSSKVAERWLRAAPSSAAALPPLWFVGLHETMAGQVVDRVPRIEGPRYLRERERQATTLYRSLWPEFHRLANRAMLALTIASLIAMAACSWNSRRLPVGASHLAAGDGAVRRALEWIARHGVAPTPLERAGFFFALQSIARCVSHRVSLAGAFAVGVSVLVLVGRAPDDASGDAASIPVVLLAAQSLVVASVLTGFRHATRVPSELRASSTFCLAWSGQVSPYVAGVKRAGWLALVVPTLVAIAMWNTVLLGRRFAVLHFGVGLGVAGVLMEAVFVRDRRLPFVSAYAPGIDANAHAIAYGVAVVGASLIVAWAERAALDASGAYALLLVALVAPMVCLKAADRLLPSPGTPLEIDEPPSLPTQRLDLAS